MISPILVIDIRELILCYYSNIIFVTVQWPVRSLRVFQLNIIAYTFVPIGDTFDLLAHK